MSKHPPSRPQRVAVIGGGISGVAAAHRLIELAPQTEVRLFEAGGRLGGVLETETCHGFQIELGSDSFITNRPGAIGLCKRIGFEDELLHTNDAHRKTYVVYRGRLEEVPAGFLLMAPTQLGSVLTTPILSLRGKLRLAWERFVPRKADNDDESLAHFVRRRLGREAFDRIVQPLVGGIYTADAEKLSLRATLPRFLDMERDYGSLIRAARIQAKNKPEEGGDQSGARYSLFVTPRRGLSSMVDAIVARLPEQTVQLNTPVEQVSKSNGGWMVKHPGGEEAFDAVIVAAPAPRAARLLASLDAELGRALEGIPYAGAATVSLGYRREQIKHPLDGFGFVVPEVEGREILAGSFSSVKFAGRAPDGCELIRIFVGGAKRPDLLERSDDELRALVNRELADLLGVSGEPLVCRISRYAGAMPQYHVGHLDRVAQIEQLAAAHSGLELCGNAYRGVGIPDCIQQAEAATERVLEGKP